MKADVLAGMNGRNQQTEPKKSDISNQYDWRSLKKKGRRKEDHYWYEVV
jgi:hypothetical protein